MFELVLPNLFVFYATSRGANSYLLIGKRTILIDTGLKCDGQLLEDSLKAAGLKPKDVDTVCHTHGHADHFGADYLFPKAEIMMHEADAQYVERRDDILTAAAALGSNFFPKVTALLADSQLIDAKPFSLKVIHTPGHTLGSVCLYEPKLKMLFSGDTLFATGFGRYDFPNSSRKQLLASLKLLSGLDFSTLLPGHGLISKSPRANLAAAIKELE